MIVSEYTHVFDSVQFGIDLRNERVKRELTQDIVGRAIGYEGSAVISALERAEYDDYLKLAAFLRLCQLFDMHPFDYFDLQKASTIDLFKKLG